MYDIGCLYLGVNFYLLSLIEWSRVAFDSEVEAMSQKVMHNGVRVKPAKLLDNSALDPWKCYYYWHDNAITNLF